MAPISQHLMTFLAMCLLQLHLPVSIQTVSFVLMLALSLDAGRFVE
jgi:hypothetical protein